MTMGKRSQPSIKHLISWDFMAVSEMCASRRAQSRPSALQRCGVDGRDTPGHDDKETTWLRQTPCSAYSASLRCLLAVFHPLQLQPVGVEEEHGIIVIVIFLSRIDNGGVQLVLQECLQLVHLLSAAELERIVMKSNITATVLVLLPLRIRRADPEQGLAVAPADGILVLLGHLEAEEVEQFAVELPGFFIVADPDHQMIDADDA